MGTNYWVGQKVHLGFPIAIPKTQMNLLANPMHENRKEHTDVAVGRRGVLKSTFSVLTIIFVQSIFHFFSRKFNPDSESYQFK